MFFFVDTMVNLDEAILFGFLSVELQYLIGDQPYCFHPNLVVQSSGFEIEWFGFIGHPKMIHSNQNAFKHLRWLNVMYGFFTSPSKIFIQNKLSSKTLIVTCDLGLFQLTFKTLCSKQVVFKTIGG